MFCTRNISWKLGLALCLVAVGHWPSLCVAQQPDNLTAEQVNNAIQKGIRHFQREQIRTTGSWGEFPKHKGGVTALVTLSLLLAGVEKDDAMIQRAVGYLNKIELENNERLSVYTASLLTMVYCELDADVYRSRIRKAVKFLVQAQIARGGGVGGWGYTVAGGTPDGSNSQFAILALHEASKIGITVDQFIWRDAQSYWEDHYRGRGRFIYREDVHHRNVATGSMVCAGIASLIIIDEHLRRPAPLNGDQIACCESEEELEMVDAAAEWMASRFSTSINPSDAISYFQPNVFYYLYSMERAARLSGQRFFGEYDWYREGASKLVKQLKNSQNWVGAAQAHGENMENVATAFALLFLSKGRRPVVIGKYQHSRDNDWDRHRKGVHFLTQALERDWESKLTWQAIDAEVATVDDLRQTPVLHISGKNGLDLGAKAKAALKKYIEYGGFIVAEACEGDGCGENSQFDKDFRALLAELFPENQLQLLEPTHPVYSAQYNLTGNAANGGWPLYGLQTSCRTSVIYCQRNLAGFWRVNRPAFMADLPERAKNQVNYSTQLGINIVTYATGRSVKDKLDNPKVLELVDNGPGERTVMIPKLLHNGYADDAPNAWQNIMIRASFDLKQRFKIERQSIAAVPDQLSKHPMVFMHGRAPFTWTAEEHQALRDYLDFGFLFADSVCSSPGFVESFRQQIKQVFPNEQLQRIPPDDPIWSDEGGGYQLNQVSMHQPNKDLPGGVRRLRIAPQLEGIKRNGRWVVVFSPHDLSCAMENASDTQCAGYDKDDAAKLGVNIILYALRP